MSKYVLITIFASFLLAVTNNIDKFLLNDSNKNNLKILVVFSTLIAGGVFTPIWLILSNFSVSINLISLICILLSSGMYALATFLYFKALKRNDASVIVTMFQLIPVFTYILGLIFFEEKLSVQQIIGAVIILISAIVISFDSKEKNNAGKVESLILMILSSLFFAVYFILFDIALRHSEYNVCAFWYQIGLLIIGIILICIRDYRETFIESIKNKGKIIFSLNMANESINLVGNLLMNFANTVIPIALVNILNGLQGVFVFIIEVIGAIILPRYFKKDFTSNDILKKVTCLVLSVIGLIIMFV